MGKLPLIDIDRKEMLAPHVVILGAGASKAALPNGDANGIQLPLMNDLLDLLSLTSTIKAAGYKEKIDNFEGFYSDIYAQPEFQKLRQFIEEEIFKYFSTLKIPAETTIYDYLILSLTKKDIIATFNWDPLLLQAYARNLKIKDKNNLPQLLFLHGSVYQGVCLKHRKLGYLGTECDVCQKPLSKVKLLYPTKVKDYNSDPVIKAQWQKLNSYLKYCYFLTIFGYSAPVSDVEAVDLLKSAWHSNEAIDFSQIEIIDIKERSELENTWGAFTIREHYGVAKDFRESWLWHHPRQSCEALFDATMQMRPRKDNPFPEVASLEDLHQFINKFELEKLHV